ncbi:hypothetical protein ACHAPA_011809 [Fusarium lateritium]
MALVSPESHLSLDSPLNIDDLQLFYHFITTVSLTFGDDVLWRDKVSRLGFEHHFILHLMLALSALHLGRVRSTEAAKYEQLAEMHHSIGLRKVTDLLPQINATNCSALYIAVVLICNFSFAKPQKKGNILVTSEGTEVSLWHLFRGVRFVIETMGIPTIFSGILGPLGVKDSAKIPASDHKDGFIPWEEPLASLASLISDTETSRLGNLAVVHEALVSCFRDVYGTSEQPEHCTHGKTHAVMRWLWFLEGDFIEQVKSVLPGALVLISYFAVLIQTLDCFWFMEGWAHHIMDGVLEHLDSEYIVWTIWPRNQLEARM